METKQSLHNTCPESNNSFNISASSRLLQRVGLAANLQHGHPYHIVPPSFYPPLISLLILMIGLSVIITVRGNFGPLLDPVYLSTFLKAQDLKYSGADLLFSYGVDLFAYIWRGLLAPWLVTVYPLFLAGGFLAFPAGVLTWISLAASEEIEGFHTIEVQNGFRVGIILFIVSEVILFFSFFWAFFHAGLTNNSLGNIFPPEGLRSFDWWQIPLLNTLILLSSGLSISLAHEMISAEYALKKAKYWWHLFLKEDHTVEARHEYYPPQKRVNGLPKDQVPSDFEDAAIDALGYEIAELTAFDLHTIAHSELEYGGRGKYCFREEEVGDGYVLEALYVPEEFLNIRRIHCPSRVDPLTPEISSRTFNTFGEVFILDTVFRGITFALLQALEYVTSPFCINDSVYGSTFFALTGLHGAHVIIGTIALALVVAYPTDKYFFVDQFGVPEQSYLTWKDTFAKELRLESVIKETTSPNVPCSPVYRYDLMYWGHRVGFDGAVWYWHFVDVVWLFVFIFVYWWATRI